MLKESIGKIGDLGCAKKLTEEEIIALKEKKKKSKEENKGAQKDSNINADSLSRQNSKVIVDIPEERGN